MSNIDNQVRAEEARVALAKMQKEYLVNIDDAVVVVRDKHGKIKLNQSINLTAAGAASGSYWGLLIGFPLYLPLGPVGPLVGITSGAAMGALSGKLSDAGINDKFMKNLGATLQPGTAALFVLVRNATTDKVLDGLRRFEGKVLQTSLPRETEAALEEALATAA